MSDAKIFTVPHESCAGSSSYVSRHMGVAYIRLPEVIPHAEQYRVTIEPLKSKRERKIDVLRVWCGNPENILTKLEAIDSEDP